MNLLGLNGLGFSYGRVDQYFVDGVFPRRWNWGYRHAWEVMQAYGQQHGSEPYVGIGFSDGATLMHEVAQLDERCAGFIAHSGMFRLPWTTGFRRSVPCLLLRTERDLTPTYKATKRAYEFYKCYATNVSNAFITIPKTTWHGHEFANGLPFADLWTRLNFNFPLPLNEQKNGCAKLGKSARDASERTKLD